MQRAAMTPISEKDTIFETSQRGSLQSSHNSQFALPEEQKRSQAPVDDRRITGTGKYNFDDPQDQYGQEWEEEFYEDDFEDVSALLPSSIKVRGRFRGL